MITIKDMDNFEDFLKEYDKKVNNQINPSRKEYNDRWLSPLVNCGTGIGSSSHICKNCGQEVDPMNNVGGIGDIQCFDCFRKRYGRKSSA